MAQKRVRHQNDIFTKLIEHDEDLIGMIAYANYKFDKLDYCKKISSTKGTITQKDIIAFYETNSEKRSAERRNKANVMLLNFLEKAFLAKREVLLNESFGNLLGDLQVRHDSLSSQLGDIHVALTNQEAIEEKAKDKFWSKNFGIGILQNFLASLLWLVIVFFIVQGYAKSNNKPAAEVAKEIILGEQVSPSSKSTQQPEPSD